MKHDLRMAYWGIILAAGESRRMGTPKPFLRWRGKTFVEHIHSNVPREAGCKQASGVGGTIIVFNVSHKRIVRSLGHLKGVDVPGAVIVWNAHVERGQIYSLTLALRRVPHDAAGILLCLVDHPCVKKSTYRAILRCALRNSDSIIIPVHRGRRGHPVVFPRRLFGALKKVSLPDGKAGLKSGARDVVEHHAASVIELKTADAGVLLDIDTPFLLFQSLKSS